MIVPEFLVHILKPWADFYSHSKTATTVVQYVHIGGLLMGGGLAIAADRGTLRALRIASHERSGHLRDLADVHRWVLSGLAAVVVSGIALLAADVETFFGSWVFWTKMTLVIILLANGYRMTRTEAALRHGAAEDSAQWNKLHSVAVTSLALWFVVAALGVALANFS
ncbi:MAG: DUF6644 family protein [Gemmatimonadaceae bacterium]